VTVIPPGSAKTSKRIRLNGAPREIVFAP
jgi:hypothetical protein